MILLVCDAIRETESFSLSQVCLLHFQKVAGKIQRRGKGTNGEFQLSLLKFLKQKIVLYVNGKR